MSAQIHPSSVVENSVKLGAHVEVGPFCYISGDVEIGDHCKLLSHVTIGNAQAEIKIGQDNVFYPGSVIGGLPQDLKYKNEKVKLEIGDHNVFRECTTVNLGTPTGIGITKIGSHGLFMAYVHIAHDCVIGDHVVVANSTNFAGHIIVEDHVKIGGACNFNQFIRLGEHSYITGISAVNKDVLPYTIVRCLEGQLYAVSTVTNKIGLERSGFSQEQVSNIHKAIRILLKGSGTMEELLEKIQTEVPMTADIEKLLQFIRSSERGIAKA
ncbi:MAG: acyl-ACP--UDP-N-acetylglucosamine O-acyltransferase [Bdellovibrionaceae bacterium]|nr:acyl-ACP--UDP-N-acetylglucosamine O-acyltransferase [Pseudobdellovibrionaceae bacterium]